MNTKLHAISDGQSRPLNLFVTADQVSDYVGAWALLSGLPDVDWLPGDRGYDAGWFRDALKMPARRYPRRILVLMRKAQDYEWTFLRAWRRHFQSGARKTLRRWSRQSAKVRDPKGRQRDRYP